LRRAPDGSIRLRIAISGLSYDKGNPFWHVESKSRSDLIYCHLRGTPTSGAVEVVILLQFSSLRIRSSSQASCTSLMSSCRYLETRSRTTPSASLPVSVWGTFPSITSGMLGPLMSITKPAQYDSSTGSGISASN
jgi:hypothetical protein